jgi:murein DD-endopeptidase MepM/ murein hydrolase activator NlpD
MPLNYSQLPYLKAAGFSGDALRKAWAISQRESGGRPDAYNGNAGTGDQSYGLFQINMLGNLGPARRKQFGLKDNADLLDPATNARVAYQMSKGGTDFGAWAVGPNAYKGAPASASAKFNALYNQYNPGSSESGGAVPAKTQRQVQQADGSENRKLAAMGLLEQVLNRHGNQNVSVMGLFGALQRKMQGTKAEGPRTITQPEMPSVSPVKGELITSAGWKGTHVTDGLDWNHGQKTAGDIMSNPGTPVGAPEDGTIVRWGSAQGGEALYFKGASGKMYWLGHIDGRLPVGTRVSKDQPIAKISSDHKAPHLHIDQLSA